MDFVKRRQEELIEIENQITSLTKRNELLAEAAPTSQSGSGYRPVPFNTGGVNIGDKPANPRATPDNIGPQTYKQADGNNRPTSPRDISEAKAKEILAMME